MSVMQTVLAAARAIGWAWRPIAVQQAKDGSLAIMVWDGLPGPGDDVEDWQESAYMASAVDASEHAIGAALADIEAAMDREGHDPRIGPTNPPQGVDAGVEVAA